MLSSFTWQDYLYLIAIATMLYYLWVIVRFFRKEMVQLFHPRLIEDTPTIKAPDPTSKEDEEQAFTSLEIVVDSIRHEVFEAQPVADDKQALLTQITGKLAGFSYLSRPAFRAALNNFIIDQAEQRYSITFNEHELNTSWDQLLRKHT